MAAIPRPTRGTFVGFFKRSSPYDLFIAFFLGGSGLATATKYYSDAAKGPAIAIAAMTVLVCGFTVTKILVLWRAQSAKESAKDLLGCLYTLESILKASAERNPRLRLTILVPERNGQELLQLTDYVGDERGGATALRRFPSQCGVAGKAYREREPLVATRQSEDYEEFVRELVSDWGYTEEDARHLDPSSRSWIAVPLTKRDGVKKVHAVVFADSVDSEFFTDERAGIVMSACVGIALFVDDRYNG